MIQLEKYGGTKSRHTCPACNSKGVFVRYTDERGEYVSFDVGRCNRESKCGYHYKPKQYYADNPNVSKFHSTAAKHTNAGANRARQTSAFVEIKTRIPHLDSASFDFIAPEHLTATLSHYDRNDFVQFLFDLFPDCSEEIQAVLKMYFVGTYEDYCCFPQIDRLNRVCKAKLIRFDRVTGKRLKGQFDTSSLKTKLKLKEDFNYKQIFFGEHLLRRGDLRPIVIVEAEKTAIIASLCFPNFVWLSCNSKTWLKAERLQRLYGRLIILCPDADGFELWREIAASAQRQGLTVKVSNLIENHATDEQRANGYDLADYLINQQREINAYNSFSDSYNSKLEKILNDESSFADFETILNEQKAILEISGGLSETEAESLTTQPNNLREIVLSI